MIMHRLPFQETLAIKVYETSINSYTVEPPNKGHIGEYKFSCFLLVIERLSSFRVSQCIKTMGNIIYGTSSSVLCREVYCTVSLLIGTLYNKPLYSGTSEIFQRVHYQRFHCSGKVVCNHWTGLLDRL